MTLTAVRTRCLMFFIGVMACGNSHSAPDPATYCDAEQPSLTECSRGEFHADCPGSGPPVLACGELDCLWFTTGCVALGYSPSPCPADDICCLDDWPFEQPGEPSFLYPRLYALGTAPWDGRAFLSIPVEIDNGLEGPESPTFECPGDNAPVGLGSNHPCAGWLGSPVGYVTERVVIDVPNGGVGGWYPWIEVSPTESLSRVCVMPYSDVSRETCIAALAEPLCASVGSVTLGWIPASSDELTGLPVRIDVTFSELHYPGGATEPGFRLTGAFAL